MIDDGQKTNARADCHWAAGSGFFTGFVKEFLVKAADSSSAGRAFSSLLQRGDHSFAGSFAPFGRSVPAIWLEAAGKWFLVKSDRAAAARREERQIVS